MQRLLEGTGRGGGRPPLCHSDRAARPLRWPRPRPLYGPLTLGLSPPHCGLFEGRLVSSGRAPMAEEGLLPTRQVGRERKMAVCLCACLMCDAALQRAEQPLVSAGWRASVSVEADVRHRFSLTNSHPMRCWIGGGNATRRGRDDQKQQEQGDAKWKRTPNALSSWRKQ